jgi:hypothetical protein
MHMPYYTSTLCGTAHTNSIAEAKEWQLHYTFKRLSNYYHSHTIHDDHQLIHVRLKHLLHSDALLHVICWYLPGSGSTQLHALDLMSRYTHLAAIVDEITATQPSGSLVVMAGDLNAKVGTAMPLSTKAAGTILQHNAASLWHTQAPAHQF